MDAKRFFTVYMGYDVVHKSADAYLNFQVKTKLEQLLNHGMSRWRTVQSVPPETQAVALTDRGTHYWLLFTRLEIDNRTQKVCVLIDENEECYVASVAADRAMYDDTVLDAWYEPDTRTMRILDVLCNNGRRVYVDIFERQVLAMLHTALLVYSNDKNEKKKLFNFDCTPWFQCSPYFNSQQYPGLQCLFNSGTSLFDKFILGR